MPSSDILLPLTLVLGGARSGKSRHAQALAEAAAQDSAGRLVYIATAQGGDGEMRARIAQHQLDRGEAWETVEAPVDLAGALRHAGDGAADGAKAIILVDCLTLWLSNLMGARENIPEACDDLVAQLHGLSGRVIFVSNEVGLGIVPDNALAREFRDHAGRLHQAIAEVADRVLFVAAGLPMQMK